VNRLVGTIARLANAACTVERRSGHYVEGRWERGAVETFSILASMQPVTGLNLVRLPEGQRTREHVTIFTETKLQTADARIGVPADVVSWNGFSYEVQTVEAWDSFWKCIAAKTGQ
jgi:hypothetical protein